MINIINIIVMVETLDFFYFKVNPLNQDLEEVEIDRDKENLKMEIEKVDEQINRLVYELYSLTQEEIKIVENEA